MLKDLIENIFQLIAGAAFVISMILLPTAVLISPIFIAAWAYGKRQPKRQAEENQPPPP